MIPIQNFPNATELSANSNSFKFLSGSQWLSGRITRRYLILVVVLLLKTGISFSQSVDSISVFPNLFLVSTTVQFDLLQSDTLSIVIFNSFGQIAETALESSFLSMGSYSFSFGTTLPPGIYFVRLGLGSHAFITKKVIKGGVSPVNRSTEGNFSFSVFPNPSTDFVHLRGEGLERIQVSDGQGRIIYSSFACPYSVSLSQFSAGVYYILVLGKNGREIARQRLVKL